MTLNPRHEEGLFYLLAAIGGLVSAIGIGAALYMEHSGHVVTGMNNQIVWGIPHVFAIFLIVAASGVLNVASIGSVGFLQGLGGARPRPNRSASLRPGPPRPRPPGSDSFTRTRSLLALPVASRHHAHSRRCSSAVPEHRGS